MIILIVDNQFNEIDELMKNINFKELGFDQVFCASGTDEALNVLKEHPVQVLLSDVELPSQKGLELNEIVRNKYPKIVRILLASHKDFFSAQEGIRLGCFDYLVRPIFYPQMVKVLTRASLQVNIIENISRMKTLGELLDSHRSNLLNGVIMDLFGKDEHAKSESLSILNEAGYEIDNDSFVKLLLVDLLDYNAFGFNQMSNDVIIMEIKKVLANLKLCESVSYIVGKNRYSDFAILFFSSGKFELDHKEIENLYTSLEHTLNYKIACYVGDTTTLGNVRPSVELTHQSLKDNVVKKPGIFYSHRESDRRESDMAQVHTPLGEYLRRWDFLLKAGQRRLLQKDIFSYLDNNLKGFDDLYLLHQRITQIFINYFYEQGIDIVSVFGRDMSYEKYMQSYTDIDSFKIALEYLINFASAQIGYSRETGYVEKAKTYILENNDKLFTVKDVSKYVGLNAEYFTRLFKKETGFNIKEYIIQCKITSAKELLEKSSLPISAVAQKLGYSNFSHFTQMFKHEEGVTPREYRLKNNTGRQ